MESVSAWATFWGWTLVITLAVFALLAVVVAIGGFFDVRELFRTIDEQHGEQHGENHSTD